MRITKTVLILLIGIYVFIPSPTQAKNAHTNWQGSMGMGLTFSPTNFLLTPRLEFQWKHRIWLGPLIQIAPGDATLFTGSFTGRMYFGNHKKLKPSAEVGAGIAAASSGFSSKIGIHLLVGMGVEYQFSEELSIGTMFRGNFAPPLKTFFVSWPIVLARLKLS